jgi:hypothetical protein
VRKAMPVMLGVLLLLAAEKARGEQYWITYEGNAFPEKEGWIRHIAYGGAKRWIENSTLVIDSRESIEIWDYYEKQMNGKLDPGPGEMFLLQWRSRVDECTPWGDPGVGIYSDGAWAVLFTLNTDSVRSGAGPGEKAKYAPGVYHDFEFRSFDMRNYELRIDGASALLGTFKKVVSTSLVGWGDTGGGGASLARWDYFRFGVVVPEPHTGLLVALCLASRRVSR